MRKQTHAPPGNPSGAGSEVEELLQRLKGEALYRLMDAGLMDPNADGRKLTEFEWFWEGCEDRLRGVLERVRRRPLPRLRGVLRLLDDYDGALFLAIWVGLSVALNVVLTICVLRLLPR